MIPLPNLSFTGGSATAGNIGDTATSGPRIGAFSVGRGAGGAVPTWALLAGAGVVILVLIVLLLRR